MIQENSLVNAQLISELIQEGGSPYLLLADRNELGYSTKLMNWEHFKLASVINSSDITMLCNTRGHHVSNNSHVSFIYLLSHNMWVTQSTYSREGSGKTHCVGGMNVYSEYQLKFRDNCIYKIDISNTKNLNGQETESLISFIKDGYTFFLACELDNGSYLSLLVDLPMVNESGEYQMKIKPFAGFPGAIFYPNSFSAAMTEVSESVQKHLALIGFPSFTDAPNEITSQETRKIPATMLNFEQPCFNKFNRPGIINIEIKDNNNLLQAVIQSIPYSQEELGVQTIKIVKCTLQVCE